MRLAKVLGRKWNSAGFHLRHALGMGALPNALILGAAKAGTTSLFEYLSQHPSVCPCRHKETHYFEERSHLGDRWYRANFARKRGQTVTIEASPSYLPNPSIPAKVARTLVAPRLIVLLREPVDRAYSHYHHSRALGREPLATFEEALEREEERVAEDRMRLERGDLETSAAWRRFSYRGWSTYGPQLERWLAAFPRNRFLFIRSEDLYADPRSVLARVEAFLGLEPFPCPDLKARNQRDYAPPDPATRRRLQRAFEHSNRQVAQLTGIGWPERVASRRPAA
jgi:hypothetical protein